ncbi:conserved hypothetical protein (plasmid) [Bacillus cereus AH820]|uniref:Uncharacterized protein n=3 Tax=Bacillus cereus TaxID=1396 RepID=Q74NM9_BACC1|nr:hypothetical protein BCE_A0215 [Bacillus cereus ATCC 10987]ACK92735.1 conserved hypothetical protein [Bacillus cereus AH820]KLA18449.1 hypothetical protein B4087_5758 [Bacillus cereus]KZD51688.1 hypothetical protein B4088_5989 [Bacillus cereus]KZD73115.1 hypothetical protein B4120_4722 [Bacillus cereus]
MQWLSLFIIILFPILIFSIIRLTNKNGCCHTNKRKIKKWYTNKEES